MITPEEALELVLRAAQPLTPCAVALEDAIGLTLAEDVAADRDYPPFARSMMDGYAVRLGDAGTKIAIHGEVPAGSVWRGEVASGGCVEILTGAPCPRGAEAVVPKEHVERTGDLVTLPVGINPGQNIAPQGSDCRQGQRVLATGHSVTGMAVAAMASFGKLSVWVTPRPTLGIITTGGEFAPTGESLHAGQIRNSNGPMLAALARQQGIAEPRQWHAADNLETIVAALEEASRLDIVLLTGGVSVGTYDLVPAALARHGAETIFHGVKQKPGKPMLFAHQGPRLFFALPGNPLACHLGFHRYVTATIRKTSGRPARQRQFVGQLANAVETKAGRTIFLPARAEPAADSATGWAVEVLPGASSADIFQGGRANCYVEMPPIGHVYTAGDTCCFTWLGHEPWVE